MNDIAMKQKTITGYVRRVTPHYDTYMDCEDGSVVEFDFVGDQELIDSFPYNYLVALTITESNSDDKATADPRNYNKLESFHG